MMTIEGLVKLCYKQAVEKGWAEKPVPVPDLEYELKRKLEYNATRSHRHGGKRA